MQLPLCWSVGVDADGANLWTSVTGVVAFVYIGAATAEIKMSHTHAEVRIKRAYDPPSPDDGARILVDRMWPRGITKAKAAIAQWMKDVAPSTELRQWFGHDPERWEEFRRRYEAELAGKSVLLEELRDIARKGPLTLVYSAHDELHNQAVVLRDTLVH